MQSEKQSLFTFIKGSPRVVIPFYQRNYTWSNSEVNLLLKDVQNIENNEYFFGIVLFKNDHMKRIIIDGQQRVTTFYLILKVISENPYLDEKSKEKIDNYLSGFSIEMFNKNNENFLLDIIKNKDEDILETETNNYIKNYKTIKSFFKNIVSQEKILNFVSNLEKVVFSVVSLDQNVDEHLAFSRLNSSGKKLNAYDLFKNHLLSELFYNNKDKYDEREINNIVESLDNLVLDYKNENDINDLLRRFLSFQTGKLTNNSTNVIYKEYTDYYDSVKEVNGDNTSLIIYETFLKFGLIFKYILDSNNIFKNDLILLIDSFKTYANILIDIIWQNSNVKLKTSKIEFTDDNKLIIKECFKILEIYKIRREFCGEGEKYLTRYIPTIPEKIKSLLEQNKAKNLSYSDIFYYLLIVKNSKDNSISYVFPSDEVFNREFKINRIYKNKAKFVKPFFSRMSLLENKSIIDFKNYSIEHIMPQNLSKWIENGFKDDELKIEELRDTIGNLTITAYNSEYSNYIFEDKKREMKKNESFYLNNWIFEQPVWNTTKILERADVLLEKIYTNYNFKDHIKKMSLIVDDKADVYDKRISDDKLTNFYKNKPHFFNIDKIDVDQINEIIYEYCCNGLSYEGIEKKLLGRNYNGWVIKSIVDALDLIQFKNSSEQDYLNIKNNLKHQIEYLSELIRDIQNNKVI